MRSTFACVALVGATAACDNSNQQSSGGGGTSASANGSTAMSSSSKQASSQAAVATVGAGGGGAGGMGGADMGCNPPADPKSLYARDDLELDLNKVSMCKYRKKVLLAVNIAAL